MQQPRAWSSSISGLLWIITILAAVCPSQATPPPEPLWTFSSISSDLLRPFQHRGRILVYDSSDRLTAFSAEDGSQDWAVPAQPPGINRRPLIVSAGGNLYAQDGGRVVHLLDPADGSTLWSYSETNFGMAVRDRSFYLTRLGSVAAYRAKEDGSLGGDYDLALDGELWTSPFEEFFLHPWKSALGTLALYATNWYSTVVAFDRDDGKERWRSDLGAEISPVGLGLNERVYLVVGTGDLAALSFRGELLWRFRDAGPGGDLEPECAPVFDPAGNALYVSGSEILYSVDSEGTENWHLAGVDPDVCPVTAGGVVYLQTASGSLQERNAGSGDLHWSLPLLVNELTVDPTGRLFATERTGLGTVHKLTALLPVQVEVTVRNLSPVRVEVLPSALHGTGEPACELAPGEECLLVGPPDWTYDVRAAGRGGGETIVRIAMAEQAATERYVITPSFFDFFNASDLPVTISWLPTPDDPIPYVELAPGEQYIQGTYPGHRWLIDDGVDSLELAASVGLTSYDILAQERERQPATSAVDPTRKYDEQSYLTAHNAMANNEDRWFHTQQQFNWVTLMEDHGVRAFELDVHYHDQMDGSGPGLYLCHGSCDSFIWIPGYASDLTLFQDALTDIATFLRSNPSEVITVFIEQHVDGDDAGLPTAEINQAYLDALHNSGAFDLVFWPDRTPATPQGVNTFAVKPGTNDPANWPTIQRMGDQRLVLFVDKHRGHNRTRHVLPFVWHYVRESAFGDQDPWYSDHTSERDQSLNRGSGRTLVRLNHFAESGTWVAYPACVNRSDLLLRRAREYASFFGRVPNFVTLDHVQAGGGGLLVDAMNGQSWNQPKPVDALKQLEIPDADDLHRCKGDLF